ncbi:hypothetical protein LXA43DRAFT_892969, partial [Ganoderma leucocontextum]
LRLWAAKHRAIYQDILYDMEGGGDAAVCTCGRPGPWCCLDCVGRPSFCGKCCRMAHGYQPLHRVEYWTGTYYGTASLRSVHVSIPLGHSGKVCPLQASWVIMDSDRHSPCPESSALRDPIIGPNLLVAPCMMVIVDTTGVHEIPVAFCSCPNADLPDVQLLRMGFYPATAQRPKTAFTFRLLDDFLLTNKECKTSAMNYWNKIRCTTNDIFPHTVPDRYRDLLRVSRQWQNLKLRKWNGVGFEDMPAPMRGSLAVACPRPGINLPDGWEKDPERLIPHSWKYMPRIIMDGNFSTKYQPMKNPQDDVRLADGQSFMVTSRPYKEHLKTVVHFTQKLECHKHRAVLAASSQKALLEATGIGAAACSRHGFFFPHCMVDFQKGEQQRNMDYCLCQVALYLAGVYILLALYDIWCHYYIHLPRRIQGSPGLSVPENLDIVRGIGQFHVHGHCRECYPRFSPNFIPGAGILLGEVIESLWPDTNHVQSDDVVAWTAMAENAARERQKNVQAMDIYEVHSQKLPTRAQILLELSQNENSTRDGQRGSAAWISGGLKIEETRQARALKLGSPLSDKLALEQAHSKLLKDIEKFHKNARQYLRSGVLESALTLPQDVSPLGMEWDALEDGGDGIDSEQDPEPAEDALPVPEQMVIALPSSLGPQFCKTHNLRPLVAHERKLRIGQMNDVLHAIHVGVGYKSFLYQYSVRTATSQRAKLRSFDNVHLANDAVLSSARLYTMARAALIQLYDDNEVDDKQALTSLLAKYQALAKQDLKANTAIIQQAVRGVSNVNLPRFWSVDVEDDSQGSGWMKEMYRVVWLRAHARKTRWEEEITIIPIEMECILQSFGRIQKTWDFRYNTHTLSGYRAFAARQASLWGELHSHASSIFANAIDTYQPSGDL